MKKRYRKLLILLNWLKIKIHEKSTPHNRFTDCNN